MPSKCFKIIVVNIFILSILPLFSFADSENKLFFKEPLPTQLIKAEQLFSWLFTQQSLDKAKEIAIDLDLSWQESEHDIRLIDNAKTGAGDYRFSKAITSGIVVMAPHRYHDKHTGVITKIAFNKFKLTSVALNSLPRYSGKPVAQSADLARSFSSFHSAYARAFVKVYPMGKLIQLHGFSAEKRKTREAQQADIIISNGTAWPGAYLLDLQTCLSKHSWKTLRYPKEVSELGATSNSIGKLLRQLGHAGFIHIELSANTRDGILNKKKLRSNFVNCMLEGEL
ncbi:MAG: hypothetical protein JXR16_08530 [Bermanella sp.]